MLNFFLNANFHHLGNGQMKIIYRGLGIARQQKPKCSTTR